MTNAETSAGGARVRPAEVTEVAPGILVASEHQPWARAVALGAQIAVGSIDETDAQAGAAHLIEHLLFRGTDRFGPGEVDRLFDELGAELQATTDRSETQATTWVLEQHLPAALDAMGEILWRPTMADDDLDQEREIVLEELAMVEDEPQELCFELLGDALFPESPLGRPVIGRKAVIETISRDALVDFHRARYADARIVFGAIGAVDHDALCAEVIAGLPDWRTTAPGWQAPVRPQSATAPSGRIIATRATEQAHIALSAPAFGRGDARRTTLAVLDALLGGPPSSRLFQEIRERRGLAYSVSSFADLQSGFGSVGVYVGTRPERVTETLVVLADELRRLGAGEIDPADLAWARTHVAGRRLLAVETAGGRLGLLTDGLVTDGRVRTAEDLERELDAVNAETIAALAGELWGDLASLAVVSVGPNPDVVATALDREGLGTAGRLLERTS